VRKKRQQQQAECARAATLLRDGWGLIFEQNFGAFLLFEVCWKRSWKMSRGEIINIIDF
jgi:hypothetical protein